MIAHDLLPLSFVHNSGFKALINFMSRDHETYKNYTVPTRWQLSRNLIPTLYGEGKAIIKRMTESTETVSITTDMWTSIHMDSYMTVTAHLVYNGKLYSPVLSTVSVSERHTASEILKQLRAIFTEWDILDKIFYVTSDNAANIKCACAEGHLKNLGCFAHTLNLVVGDGKKLVPINELIGKVRGIVAFVHHSTVATASIKKRQVIRNASNSKKVKFLKVIMDVSKRYPRSMK